MRTHLVTLCAFSFILFTSCRKENALTKTTDSNLSTDKIAQESIVANSVVSSAHWYGYFSNIVTYDSLSGEDPGADPDTGPWTDADIIKGGLAKLPQIPYPNRNYYSNISFDIPSEYNITGDSITFQTMVENTTAGGSFYAYDVVLQIAGDQHSAELHFVGDASAQSFDQYYIGNARYYNLPQIVHYFGAFETIKWVMKKNGTSAYINGKLAYKFNYGTTNRIGKVKTINVAGKGYVVINSVTLLNSFTNKKIMIENFNIDGQSHTIFY